MHFLDFETPIKIFLTCIVKGRSFSFAGGVPNHTMFEKQKYPPQLELWNRPLLLWYGLTFYNLTSGFRKIEISVQVHVNFQYTHLTLIYQV